ncbi:MAG: hypothetical protein AABY74_03515 [Planctomycetota bacterium]
MEQFSQWVTHLSNTNNLAFALVTVGTMFIVAIGVVLSVDLLFKILGIKIEKIEHH